jgi:hypothetical protein
MKNFMLIPFVLMSLFTSEQSNTNDEIPNVRKIFVEKIMSCNYDPDAMSHYEPPPIDPNAEIQLALARICVSEAGFQTSTDDCTFIYHALRNRSRNGEITLEIMRAYARGTFNTERTDSRRWIPHLRADFQEPYGWRETVDLPWSARRNGFISVYNHVGRLLRSPRRAPCDRRIDHWGARGFRRELHLSNGWHLLECGNTLNDFWSLPRS